MNNKIIDICGITIDLTKITHVGVVGGDPSWLRYTVYFIGDSKLEIYHNRKYVEGCNLVSMKREDFVKLWKNSL